MSNFSTETMVKLGQFFEDNCATLKITSFIFCDFPEYTEEELKEFFRQIALLTSLTLLHIDDEIKASPEIVQILAQNYSLLEIMQYFDGYQYTWITNRNRRLKKQQRFKTVKQAPKD